MEFIKGHYGNDIPSLKETIYFLSKCDTPLGDLCNDIIGTQHLFDFNNVEEVWQKLNTIRLQHGDYLDEPIRRLKTIYMTIYKS